MRVSVAAKPELSRAMRWGWAARGEGATGGLRGLGLGIQVGAMGVPRVPTCSLLWAQKQTELWDWK